MTDVFISYSRKDSDFVRQLHAELEQQGRDVWVDWEDIPLTANWWQEICEGIEASDTFVFVMSQASVESIICNFEVAHALDNGKRIIPVLREEIDTSRAADVVNKASLDDSARMILANRDMSDVHRQAWGALARHNWLFFQTDAQFSENVSKLFDIIETDLEHTKQHTRFLVRAREWDDNRRNNSFLLNGIELAGAKPHSPFDLACKCPELNCINIGYSYDSKTSCSLSLGCMTCSLPCMVTGTARRFSKREFMINSHSMDLI